MPPIEPKTKYDLLIDIGNDIVSTCLEKPKGIYSINKLRMQKYLSDAEKNKTGSYADFHYIHALVSTVQGDLPAAKRSYSVAVQNDSHNAVILGNYATLLVDMHKYNDAKNILKRLIIDLKLYDETVQHSVYRIALNTLDFSFLSMFKDNKMFALSPLITTQISQLKEDISYVDISIEAYKDFMKLLTSFVLSKTRQNFQPRFSINDGLDKNLVIEVFLDINSDEASELNSEFTTHFVENTFANGNYELLGKFLVFFKQRQSRYDGSENPDSLYLGMNEELGA